MNLTKHQKCFKHKNQSKLLVKLITNHIRITTGCDVSGGRASTPVYRRCSMIKSFEILANRLSV